MPITALAIGAGAGLLKSELLDRPREQKQRTLAAETQRYSPWTGLKADPIHEADPLGSALTFGSQGAMLGAGIQNAQAQQGLMKAQTNWLNAGGSPQYTAAQTATSAPTYYGWGSYGPKQSPWAMGSMGDFRF